MQTITLQALRERLERDFTTPAEKPLLVLLDVDGCHACEMFYAAIATPEISSALDPLVEMVRVVIDGQPPMFAPPVYPSIVGFLGGVRHWEGLGDPALVDELVESIQEWARTRYTNDISTSPGYRSV